MDFHIICDTIYYSNQAYSSNGSHEEKSSGNISLESWVNRGLSVWLCSVSEALRLLTLSASHCSFTSEALRLLPLFV